ncbi:MAG: hypothetical protein M1825_002868 [Sarcosagium campestre]|nr:MAG: hypothetical protein M1825_002868 [Sarcosagium campestre]
MASQDAIRPAPTVAAAAIATAIISGLLGYFLGQGSSLGLFGSNSTSRSSKREPEDSDEESNDDDDGGKNDSLSDFSSHGSNEYKLVFAVRTDLGMTKGKVAAQCSHATLACYKTLYRAVPGKKVLRRWEQQGQAKIALQVKSEDELDLLYAQALSLGLCAQIIHDAGRTQIAAGSATVLGIGPGPKDVVNQVTGHLKLL